MTATGGICQSTAAEVKTGTSMAYTAKLRKFCCSQHLHHLPPLTHALGQSADRRSFTILHTALCSPGYEHSNPLKSYGLENQQMQWVTLRSQVAPRPVSSSDIADACEIAKSQSNHHHSFPEHSSIAPQSVAQEASEPKLVSL